MNDVTITGSGVALPGREITTEELLREAGIDRDPRKVEGQTGIVRRRWVTPGQTAAGLSTEAVRVALDRAGRRPEDLERIIFVSSTGGDYLGPATGHEVVALLGLDRRCDTFDMHNTCTGFLSALDLAVRGVATGLGPTAVVACEMFSPWLTPSRPRPYVILGDACGAVLVEKSGGGEFDVFLRSSTTLRGKMIQPHNKPGRNEPAFFDFQASHLELAESALVLMSEACTHVLDAHGIGWEQVDWFLPHQPNALIVMALLHKLGVDPQKIFPTVHETGSIGAATLPTGIDRFLRSGKAKPGDRVLLCSVGGGTGYGAAYWRLPG